MTYHDDVQAAQSPKDALLVIARALDELLACQFVEATPKADAWGGWVAHDPTTAITQQMTNEPVPPQRVRINQGEDTSEVVLPKVSPERYIARTAFADAQLKLNDHLGAGEVDWIAAYGVGGPMWLYLGNRDLVMSYPEEIRRRMVEDVEQDSPEDAHEMSRDILKAACETGPGSPAMHIADGEVG